jgi:hypothetical protein
VTLAIEEIALGGVLPISVFFAASLAIAGFGAGEVVMAENAQSHVLVPVLVPFPARICGISMPASTVRRDCLSLSGIGAQASNQRFTNAFDRGDTNFFDHDRYPRRR